MIGVIGLGLIGGSLAMALRNNTEHRVYGFDKNPSVAQRAKMQDAIDDFLTEELLPKCDVVIIALYPEETVEYLQSNQGQFAKDAIVLDCCGIKRNVCREGEALAAKNNFCFMGAHPMAGLAHAGFNHARKDLFKGASMVLTPSQGTLIEKVQSIKKLCKDIGFGHVEIATPQDHDRIIAFTSQLAHIVSSSYIKSPMAPRHAGFSAGSYMDLTRVALLNEEMWTQLFIGNADFLAQEIRHIISRLREYEDAISKGDSKELTALLRGGREDKERIDKEVF